MQELGRLCNINNKKIADKLKQLVKKWAEGDLKSQSSIRDLNSELKSGTNYSTVRFSDDSKPRTKGSSTSKSAQELQEKEIEDLAMAMALSMQDQKSKTTGQQQQEVASSSSSASALYPTMGAGAANVSIASTVSINATEPRKVRAMYDFEAAEENELTFKGGDIIFVLDDSDANWWRGYTAGTPAQNQTEGLLFPSNFVTSDLTYQAEPEIKAEKQSDGKSSTSNVDQGTVVIDEAKIDRGLTLIQNCDPTGEQRPDSDELLRIEQECRYMVPLVDNELEQVDVLHAKLTEVNQNLIDAFNEYHRLVAQEVNDKRQQMSMPQYQQHQPGMTQQPQYYDQSSAPGFIPPYGIPLAGAPGAITYGLPIPPVSQQHQPSQAPQPQQQQQQPTQQPMFLNSQQPPHQQMTQQHQTMPVVSNNGYSHHHLHQQTMVYGNQIPVASMAPQPQSQQGSFPPQQQQQMSGQV